MKKECRLLCFCFTMLMLFLGTKQTQAQVVVLNDVSIVKNLGGGKLTCLGVDANGLIYGANKAGLWFLDSRKAVKEQIPALPSNAYITTLYTDSNNNFWLGCSNGFIAKKNRGVWQAWKPEEGLPAVSIESIVQTPDSVLWIATDGEGLYAFKQNRLYHFGIEEGLITTEINDLSVHGNGVHLATDEGLWFCAWENNKKIVTFLKDALADPLLTCLEGNTWAGTLDMGPLPIKKSLPSATPIQDVTWSHGEVNDLLLVNHILWIASEQGLVRWTLSENTRKISETIVQKEEAIQLIKTPNNQIFVLYASGKVEVFINDYEQHPYQLPAEIQAIASLQNKIWLGTSEGLFVGSKSGAKFVKVALPLKTNVVSLAIDQDEKIWVGSFGQGLWRLNQDGSVEHHWTEENGLLNNNVMSLNALGTQIWMGTLAGATHWPIWASPNTNRALLAEKIQNVGDYIYQVLPVTPSEVWFATDGNGLVCLKNGTTTTSYKLPSDSAPRTFIEICKGPMGHIFCASSDGRLWDFHRSQFVNLPFLDPGLESEIYGLNYTKDSLIYILHRYGFSIYNFKTGACTQLDKEINWQMPENIGLHLVTGISENELALSSGKSLALFDISSSSKPALNAVLRTIHVGDYWFSSTDMPTVDHSAHYLSISFSSNWHSDEKNIRYKYFLQGFDKEWTIGQDDRVMYPQLPPGTYTFHLQASDSGVFSEKGETSFTFTIRKPFWQTAWFIVLMLALLSAGLYAGLRYRERLAQRELEKEKGQIAQQFETLRAQINPHFLFNSFNTLVSLIEESPKHAVEYTTTLSDYFRGLLQQRDNPMVSLAEELNMLHQYLGLLKFKYETNLKVSLPTLPSQFPFGIAPHTLMILVENVVKHNVVSKKHPMHVKISIENDNYLVIENPIHPKITPESGTKLGLQNIAARYSLLVKHPVVVTQKDNVFVVKIPLIPIHPNHND